MGVFFLEVFIEETIILKSSSPSWVKSLVGSIQKGSILVRYLNQYRVSSSSSSTILSLLMKSGPDFPRHAAVHGHPGFRPGPALHLPADRPLAAAGALQVGAEAAVLPPS